MSEVLEYDGDIAMVSRWTHELLGYHFSVLHRTARVMIDVNSLTRGFGNLAAKYVKIATLLLYHDRACRLAVYTGDLHSVPKVIKISATDPIPTLVLLILTDTVINGAEDKVRATPSSQPASSSVSNTPSLSSVPIMLHSTPSINMIYTTVEPFTNTSVNMKNVTAYQVVD